MSASPPVGQGPAAVVEAPPAVVPAPTGTARLRDALRPAPVLLDAAWPSPSAAYAVGDADFGSEAAGDCSSSGGVLCPQGGFILASAAGGRSWRKAYQGSAALLGIQAWPSGGAVAWGPEALVGSTDGGRTWRPLSVPGPGWIVAASFASASDGWVTVQDGSVPPNFGKDAVFATADGGRTWREIARTNAYPRQEPGALVLGALGVSGAYIGDGEGWLDADPAIVTRDDGVTWTKLPQADQPPSGVADVAVDLSRGFRLDYASAPGAPIATDVQQTVDGGATWATLAEVGEALSGLRRAGDGSLWAVAIPTDEVDRRVGTPRWACGPSAPACGPAVWVGTGGGRAWAERSMAGLDPTVVAPLDAAHALAVAVQPDGAYRLLVTSDGGATWDAAYVPAGSAQPGPVGAVGFWSATGGWGLGLADDPRALLRTSDGGRTWALTGDLPADAYDVGFADAENGWAQMDGGTWMHTAAGGRAWSAAANAPRGQLAGFTLAPFGRGGIAGLVMAAGGGLSAALSTDDGRSWTRVPVPPDTREVAFDDPRTAWAVQDVWPQTAGAPNPLHPEAPDQRLLQTNDGGASWRVVADLGPVEDLLASPAPNAVWLVTDASPAGAFGGWALLRTTDGGAHWTVRTLPAPLADDLFGGDRLSAASADQAWLQTRSGLWTTRDGGAAWERVAAP